MKDMLSAVLLGAVVGAAATMFYLNNEKELTSVGRQLKDSTSNAMNYVNNIGRELDSMRKQA